ARSWPSAENASAWIASGAPDRPVRERTRRGLPSTRHSCTWPEYPPTATTGWVGDHASAVIIVPLGPIVNDARWRSVRAENSPTVEVPRRAANVPPSGETASGGAGGKSARQHGDAPPSGKRRPKLRSPARSHSSKTPPTEDV